MTEHINNLGHPDVFATLTINEGEEEKEKLYFSAEGVSLVGLLQKGQRVSLRATFMGGQVLCYRKERRAEEVFVYKEKEPSEESSDVRAYDLGMTIGPNHAERMNFIHFDPRPGILHFCTLGLKQYHECRQHAIVMQETFSVSCIRSGPEVVCPHFAQIRDWAMQKFLGEIWKERIGTRDFYKFLPSEPVKIREHFRDLPKDQAGVIAYDPFADKGVVQSSFGRAMVPAMQITRRPPALTVDELVGVNNFSVHLGVNWYPGVKFIASGVGPLEDLQ